MSIWSISRGGVGRIFGRFTRATRLNASAQREFLSRRRWDHLVGRQSGLLGGDQHNGLHRSDAVMGVTDASGGNLAQRLTDRFRHAQTITGEDRRQARLQLSQAARSTTFVTAFEQPRSPPQDPAGAASVRRWRADAIRCRLHGGGVLLSSRRPQTIQATGQGAASLTSSD